MSWTKVARARCEAAASGPWEAYKHNSREDWVLASAGIAVPFMPQASAEFIATARTDLPRALDVIDAADALVAALPGLDGLHDHLIGGECHAGCPVYAFTRALAVYEGKRR